MQVAEILDQKGHQVHTASPEDCVMDAVHKLVTHNIGALAVVDTHGRIAGIISERDVLRLLANDAEHLGVIKVSQLMTREVIVASPGDDVETCLATMTHSRIRHLPVCDQGKLIGMISIGDLVNSQLANAVFEARHLTALVMGQYPA